MIYGNMCTNNTGLAVGNQINIHVDVVRESGQWHFDSTLFPTPTELGNKLDSAESFSRKDADFSGTASVAASCPASHINSLTVWYPRCSPCPATPTPGPPYLSQSTSLPQLWLPDAVSVVIPGNKIIRSGSTLQKPGKWGIILGRLCKSQAAETVQQSSLLKHCGHLSLRESLDIKTTSSVCLRSHSRPSFLPAKMMWLWCILGETQQKHRLSWLVFTSNQNPE